jgi:hypothetical protein
MKKEVMEKMIDDLFKKWTNGKDKKRDRISIYVNIRDIPFEVIPNITFDYDRSLEAILTRFRGSCTPKHLLLSKLYEKMGINVEYVVYVFYWSDLDVKYPPSLRELASKLPEQYHLACLAYINDKSIVIDATWDLLLKKANFPVNEDWDGENDTRVAVNPVEKYICKSYQERNEYILSRKKDHENTNEIYKFYKELNKWLDELRKTK